MRGSLIGVLLAIGLVSGCVVTSDGSGLPAPGDSGSNGGQNGNGSGTGNGTGTGNGNGTGTGSGSGSGSGAGNSAQWDKDATLSGDVSLGAATTIPKGVTITLSAGTTIKAAMGAGLSVEGTLIAQGTASSPVQLTAADGSAPGAWAGLDIKAGGSVQLSNVAIHAAKTALNAEPDSSYTVDHLLVDTSAQALALSSKGTISHSQIHSNGDAQSMSPVAITNAAPTISDTLVDKGNSGVDAIVVDGMSASPQFDHVEVTACHCAFHFNSGSGITISGSYIHDAAYGIMNENALETKIENSNFERNSTNIGVCTGGSVTASGVYFTGKAYDVSCTGQGNTSPATAQVSGAGPRP